MSDLCFDAPESAVVDSRRLCSYPRTAANRSRARSPADPSPFRFNVWQTSTATSVTALSVTTTSLATIRSCAHYISLPFYLVVSTYRNDASRRRYVFECTMYLAVLTLPCLVGTPKFVANKMKSKGLQRLRWYCQVCEKQCRDENGFKCHAQSESHLRQMLVVGEHAGSHIAGFSQQFQSEFVALLSRRYFQCIGCTNRKNLQSSIRRFGTKRVRANQVYQEYIADKSHLHMNSTRWVTLTEFVKHLGRTGVARVDETEKGWFIAWIDNSPKALEKAASLIITPSDNDVGLMYRRF